MQGAVSKIIATSAAETKAVNGISRTVAGVAAASYEASVEAIETYLKDLFDNGDIEFKRQFAIHYKEDLENAFRDFAYEDYWETIGREKEADLQAEAEDYENERNRDRREL